MEALIEPADETRTNQSAVVCLVSGGIDSPVATWLMMKKRLTRETIGSKCIGAGEKGHYFFPKEEELIR